MTGLFFDIRNYFDQKYSGRYLALLLRELARREPHQFVKLMQLGRGDTRELKQGALQVLVEWPFAAGKRRADLAVLRNGAPLLLAEVKEDDVNSPGNETQIADYLDALRSFGGEAKFVHISRYSLPDADITALHKIPSENRRILRYRDIYEGLQRDLKPTGEMICDYLEDIGVASYKILDMTQQEGGKSLLFLLTQLLGFPHAHGLGRLHSDKAVADMPELIGLLFGNLEVLGEWIGNKNRNFFKTRLTRKCKPTPEFDLAALSKSLAKNRASGPQPLPGGNAKFIRSGRVYFYAEGKIKTDIPDEWLYVELGYDFRASKGAPNRKAQPMALFLYAGFRWLGNDGGVYELSPPLQRFPDEKAALRKFEGILKKAYAEALPLSRSAPEAIRKALKSFRIPSSS